MQALLISLCMLGIVPAGKQYPYSRVREENPISLLTNKAVRAGIKEDFFVFSIHDLSYTHGHTHGHIHSSEMQSFERFERSLAFLINHNTNYVAGFKH